MAGNEALFSRLGEKISAFHASDNVALRRSVFVGLYKLLNTDEGRAMLSDEAYRKFTRQVVDTFHNNRAKLDADEYKQCFPVISFCQALLFHQCA